VATGRRALVVATYRYADAGLGQLTAPEHDAEAFAAVLEDPEIAGFDVTMLVNQPHHVVGEAIADFYGNCRRDDLTLLYFSGHGLKDDEGRLHLAMTNTRRAALMFTAISAAQLNEAMDACPSRRKVLILDCCYSGAFPAWRTAKSDEGVQTLERFQGKGRAVLTASDATQYAFEGDDLSGSGTSSVFTRYLVEAIRSGAADLDEDGDIALDELYSYVRERVVAEMPQQRPKKQEDVEGRILIARNVHWTLPAHLRHAIESPISAQRLAAVEGLAHLHRVGNDVVRATAVRHLESLVADDSRSVSAAAAATLLRTRGRDVARPVEELAPARAPAAAPTPAAAPRATPGPVLAPEPEAEPPPSSERSRDGFPDRYVLAAIVVGGVVLFLSRQFVYDGVNDSYVTDLGFAALPWALTVGIPLVAAAQLFIVRGSVPWATGPALGLVAGATLVQLAQLIVGASYFFNADYTHSAGPGWWLALFGTAALVACVVVAMRRPPFRGRVGVGRTWRTALAVVVLAGALVAWLAAFRSFYLWFPANWPALQMAMVGLPVAATTLNGMQRLAGLGAVSVLGGWVVAETVVAILEENYWSEADRGTVVIVSALCSVAACYLAQIRLRWPSGPVGDVRGTDH
jgi:hypothetical protein